MQDLIIPTKVLTKNELSLYALHGKKILLENYSGIEAFVLIKQMEEVLNNIKEGLREKAVASIRGNEDTILGAKVQLKRKTEYEYNAPTLERLEVQRRDIDTRIKSIKKAMEVTGTWIDDATGETNTAKKISEGVTLTVTLPKGDL